MITNNEYTGFKLYELRDSQPSPFDFSIRERVIQVLTRDNSDHYWICWNPNKGWKKQRSVNFLDVCFDFVRNISEEDAFMMLL